MNETMMGTVQYRSQTVPGYCGNPFIEALPPRLDPLKAAELMVSRPVYEPGFRRMPSDDRIASVDQLGGWFIPLERHLPLYADIDRVLRSGYMNRNPLAPTFARAFHEGFEHLTQRPSRTAVPGRTITIVGESGVSKSRGLEAILSLYPPVICHTRYRQEPFIVHQLPWVKVNCPTNGSFKSTLLTFFDAVEQWIPNVLGSRNAAVEPMIVKMGAVAHRHGLGLLVIDEVQQLLHGNSATAILRYFVALQNVLGVPLILAGHEGVETLLLQLQSEAQRFSGEGNHQFRALPEGPQWEYFVKRLWHYQWTANSTALTDAWKKHLYAFTGGNPGVTVKFYQALQRDAIRRGGNEALSFERMEPVWRQDFRYMPDPVALKTLAIVESTPKPVELEAKRQRTPKPKPRPAEGGLPDVLDLAAKSRQDPLELLEAMGVVKSAQEWFPGDGWPS